MPLLTLSREHTLTLPEEVREHLGLSPGDEVALELGEESVILRRRKSVPAAQSSFRESANRKNLETPVQFVKGVGPKLAETLARRNITTVEDALYLLPNRYEDRRELRKIAALRPGSLEVFCGTTLSAGSQRTKGGKLFFEVLIGDDSGSVVCKWFHCSARYMTNTWRVGRQGIFSGEVNQFGFQREVHHPDVEWLAEGEEPALLMAKDPLNFGRILPIYPLTEGLHQKTLRKIMKEIILFPCRAR